MSDIDEKPWEHYMDSHVHRCQPRPQGRRGKPRQGDRYACECGIEYLFINTRLGGQWLPAHGDEG